ncbi:LysR-type transcriptional regulator [Sulfurospirillum diekertiae]|uniref:LysR-type transcriptional regulator n=1 Tax=Sulfurospirillum diekertiae TaxID=1854492 RepID=A0A290HBM1_9BACT|nr:LysR family transcriptional regulator [Sulfurospirillum diekertiae]ATB68952.1 LysR-type transcriptional regulator [Sulfurospirillum diekertiae]
MSLKQIECVVMVAKLKSFTKAANKLKIAQPSLSQSINILEKQIGVPLFDRSTTPISLTHAGEIYLSKANAIIELYHDLNIQMCDVTGFENGKLRLGFSQTGYHFIPDALSKFYKKFPKADIRVSQVFSTLNLEKMLLDGDVDIATLILPLHSDELSYKVIKEEQALLALPITHPLAQKVKKRVKGYPTLALSELKNEKFILPKDTQRSRPIFDNIFKKAGFEPNIFCETETFDIANSIVASGIGACFTLPQFIKEDKENKIMLFSIEEPLLSRTVVLAYKKDKRLSKIAQEFLLIAKSL